MAPRNKQHVRIIGGEWRSRTIEFPDRPGLRPTPDSVRETLFNWLAPGLYGTRVLDLCAGSGVLGLEALSRGAQEAMLIDSDRQVAGALHTAISKLAANAQVLNADAREYLGETRKAEDGFDVVFIDPPYESGLHATLCRLLDRAEWLRSGARVYLENNAGLQDIEPPAHWELLREKRAGQIEYRLFGAV